MVANDQCFVVVFCYNVLEVNISSLYAPQMHVFIVVNYEFNIRYENVKISLGLNQRLWELRHYGASRAWYRTVCDCTQ